jgi:hypothetical protein
MKAPIEATKVKEVFVLTGSSWLIWMGNNNCLMVTLESPPTMMVNEKNKVKKNLYPQFFL